MNIDPIIFFILVALAIPSVVFTVKGWRRDQEHERIDRERWRQMQDMLRKLNEARARCGLPPMKIVYLDHPDFHHPGA